jgi:glycosyltransferase involved in cell wall biosynthesis
MEDAALLESKNPLVSIALPTFNRHQQLREAVQSLLDQDYPNIEIIICDNASADATAKVCSELAAAHSNILIHRRSTPVLAIENFKSGLLLAKGRYFMWAADDDLRRPHFIGRLVQRLQENSKLVLAMTETQYQLRDGTLLPFFRQGSHWYAPPDYTTEDRLMVFTKHYYGDLVYGLYQRSALLHDGGTILDEVRFLNEIPFFLPVAAQGGIIVCKEPLFLKTVSVRNYLYAAREYGVFPNLAGLLGDQKLSRTESLMISPGLGPSAYRRLRALLTSLKPVRAHGRYFVRTYDDVSRCIDQLNLASDFKARLKRRFRLAFLRHFLKLVVRWRLEDIFLPDRQRQKSRGTS